MKLPKHNVKPSIKPVVGAIYTDSYEKYLPKWEARMIELGMTYNLTKPDLKGMGERVVAGRSLSYAVRNAMDDFGGASMTIGVDDILLKAPLVPADKGWDVGMMRNPELDQIPTHLDYGPFLVVNDTNNGRVFLDVWCDLARYGNEHRGQCAALALLYGFINIVDCGDWLKGCVEFSGNNYRETAII